MAKSATNKYQWPDGTWHSKDWVTHQQNLAASAVRDQGPGAQLIAAGDAFYKTTGTPNPNEAAPPAPDPVAPQPFDPEFEASKLGAQWNVGLSDAEAGYQKGNLAYDTGYGADGLRNTANPYSQAQLLEDNYKRSLMGAQNSYASMGQYNSGAYGRAKERENRLYAQGSDRLQWDTSTAYHGIGVGQLQTYAGNSLGVSGDAYASLKKAIYGS